MLNRQPHTFLFHTNSDWCCTAFEQPALFEKLPVSFLFVKEKTELLLTPVRVALSSRSTILDGTFFVAIRLNV